MSALRYHVNPATGIPRRCRATVSCPFGDLTTAHYGGLEEARAAFEAQMQEALMPLLAREPSGKYAALKRRLFTKA